MEAQRDEHVQCIRNNHYGPISQPALISGIYLLRTFTKSSASVRKLLSEVRGFAQEKSSAK
jgi:hypothetical protein